MLLTMPVRSGLLIMTKMFPAKVHGKDEWLDELKIQPICKRLNWEGAVPWQTKKVCQQEGIAAVERCPNREACGLLPA